MEDCAEDVDVDLDSLRVSERKRSDSSRYNYAGYTILVHPISATASIACSSSFCCTLKSDSNKMMTNDKMCGEAAHIPRLQADSELILSVEVLKNGPIMEQTDSGHNMFDIVF